MVRHVHRNWVTGAALLTVLGLLAAAPKPTDSIQWWNDHETAVSTAKKSRKAVLIEFTADWCHFCRKMERETLSDPKVVQAVNQCYVPVQLNADVYGEVLGSLGIQGLPALLLVDPQTGKATRILGYRTAEQLLKDLQVHCAPPDKSKPASPPVTDEAPGRARLDDLPPQ
jgi:thiol:disulfide interchange protein